MTDAERDLVRSRAHKDDAESIARDLGRPVATVKEFVRDHCPPPESPRPGASPGADAAREAAVNYATLAQVRAGLKSGERWKNLRLVVDARELAFFEDEFVKLVAQHRGDVTASEENQVFDLVLNDVFKFRIARERKDARDEILALDAARRDFLAPYAGDLEAVAKEPFAKAYLKDLDAKTLELREWERSRASEYQKLQDESNKLQRSLKQTRDQRFKDVEAETEDFLGLVRKLSRVEEQAREGREMELVRLAGQEAARDLGRERDYEKGGPDRALLSCDTVGT